MVSFKFLAALAVLAAIVSGPSHSAEAEPQASAGKTLLVLGDSLSAAYGIATSEGWVSLLEKRLKERKLPWRVLNASISGETTAGGLARLPGLLAEHRPRVLLIALGANDGLRGLSFDTIRDHALRMIRLAREAGAQVAIAGLRLPPNYGAAYTEGFQALFRDIARSAEVPLVPDMLAGVAENWGLMQADGLHPTAEAQPRILENVWPVLEPLLR